MVQSININYGLVMNVGKYAEVIWLSEIYLILNIILIQSKQG